MDKGSWWERLRALFVVPPQPMAEQPQQEEPAVVPLEAKAPDHQHTGSGDTFNEQMDDLVAKLGGKWMNARIAGVSHRNADGSSRQEFLKLLQEGQQLYCVPEPNNRFDKNAVAIYNAEYHQLGYLPGWLAWEVAGAMRRGYAAGCVVQGAGDDEHGVWGAAIGVMWYPDPTKR